MGILCRLSAAAGAAAGGPAAAGQAGEVIHYRVLFMERAMEEILRSQATMLEGKGASADSGADIGKAYRQQVRGARAWLARLGIPAMEVDYAALVQGENGAAAEVARFLGREEKAEAMGGCVRPELYRSKIGS